MKKLFDFMLAFATMIAGAAIASAQDFPPPQGPPPGGGQRFQMPSFAELDRNKDKKLSKDELGQMPPQFFDRLDENKDGFIDEEEFNRSRNRMGGGGGPRMNMGERFSRMMDADKDSKVTREEFARILQVFDALDKDRSGDLSQEEMNRFFQAMDEVQNQDTGGVDVNAFFDKFDKDKDGKITPEEMGNAGTFKAMDGNKDNLVTKEELAQGLRKLQEASKQKQQTPPKQ
jgi:Ca2+-binding EF-hand superfamily protein